MEDNYYLQKFLLYIKRVKGYSELTVKAYRRDISSLLAFLKGENISLSSLELKDISLFLTSLYNSNLSKRSVRRMLSSYRQFYNYLIRYHDFSFNPFLLVFSPKTEEKIPDFLSFDEEQVMLGVREAYWRGRFEVVSTRPLIIVDGAHNESGIKALRESLETFFPGQKIHGVMGVFRDKEYDKMVSVMQPLMQDIVTVTAPTERGLPAEELRTAWENSGISLTETAESVNEGLKKAIARCEEGGLIVLFGSLSLLGELNWR